MSEPLYVLQTRFHNVNTPTHRRKWNRLFVRHNVFQYIHETRLPHIAPNVFLVRDAMFLSSSARKQLFACHFSHLNNIGYAPNAAALCLNEVELTERHSFRSQFPCFRLFWIKDGIDESFVYQQTTLSISHINNVFIIDVDNKTTSRCVAFSFCVVTVCQYCVLVSTVVTSLFC